VVRGSSGDYGQETEQQRDPRLAWWRAARCGMFGHRDALPAKLTIQIEIQTGGESCIVILEL